MQADVVVENPRRRTHRSRLWRPALLAVLVVAVTMTVFGCTSIVTPPADPADPVEVFLVKDDRHVGLFLPRSSEVLVAYGYGDWDWYAMVHDQWYYVFDTVLWPTQGTLGRREVRERDREGLEQRFPRMRFEALSVSSTAARELLAELDEEYAARQDEEHYNALYRMHFVPHDDGFWFLYNCNDAVAGWLRALGCSVSWVPIRLGLALAER